MSGLMGGLQISWSELMELSIPDRSAFIEVDRRVGSRNRELVHTLLKLFALESPYPEERRRYLRSLRDLNLRNHSKLGHLIE